MIKDMEENHNWKFVYLGANQDAFAVGGAMGVGRCAQYTCDPGQMIGITRDVSDAVSSYRAHSSNVGRKAALTLPERPTQTSIVSPARRQMTSPY